MATAAKLSHELSQELSYERRSAATIAGQCLGEEPYGVRWALEQNVISKLGVASDFMTPLVVEYIEGRRFSAKVKVETKTEFRLLGKNFGMPTWGESDDPVYFDPEVMVTRQGPVMVGNYDLSAMGDYAEKDLDRFTSVVFAGEENHMFTTRVMCS
jgi:hypothetical protein